MNTEYLTINEQLVKCKTFTEEEIKSIFNDDDWNRTFKDESFLKKVGLTASPETFLTAGSMCTIPCDDGKIAGICTLRIDEKDRPKGFPINWNHWDFFKFEDKIVMIPSNDKKKNHWFKNEDEWKERIETKPPHDDKKNE